jgi:hypothetical protein
MCCLLIGGEIMKFHQEMHYITLSASDLSPSQVFPFLQVEMNFVWGVMGMI